MAPRAEQRSGGAQAASEGPAGGGVRWGVGGQGEEAEQGVGDREQQGHAGDPIDAADREALEAVADAELGGGPLGDAAAPPHPPQAPAALPAPRASLATSAARSSSRLTSMAPRSLTPRLLPGSGRLSHRRFDASAHHAPSLLGTSSVRPKDHTLSG